MASRVALVHDFLLDLRGAERVFAAICDIWPEADVFTAVYDELGTEGRFSDRAPRTSFLQHLRPTARSFRRESAPQVRKPRVPSPAAASPHPAGPARSIRTKKRQGRRSTMPSSRLKAPDSTSPQVRR